jgi:hypothetical protein
MKQVEALYTASINRMPNLSQLGIASLGPQFQQVASQFIAAAKQIETAATSVTQDVAIMVQQSNANMAAMSANVQKSAAKTASSMSEGAGAVTRFGTAVERAAFRVPAMLLVGSAMIVMLEAIKAPIDFVVRGFENLARQSLPFKIATTDLTEGLTRIASITAKPIFDLILDAMQRLSGWLKENKGWIEQVALALGNLVTAGLQPLLTGLDKKPTGLIEVINVAVTAVGYLVASIKFLSSFNTDADVKFNRPPLKTGIASADAAAQKEFEDQFLKDQGKQLDVRKARFQEYLDDIARISKQSIALSDAASGKVINTIPKVPGVNEGQTSQEIAQEFRNKLANIKTEADTKKKVFEEQANAEVISRRDAYDKIKPILEAERDQVKELITEYQHKMLAATDITNIGNSKARAKQLQLARGSLGGRGEFNQAINDQESSEKQKADKESLDIHKATLAASLKIEEEHYKAEIALIKKSVAEGHKTHEQGADEELALEQTRHEKAITAITGEVFGSGTLGETKQRIALDEEVAKNIATEKSLTQAKTEARRQDIAVLQQYSAAQVKSLIATKEAALQEADALGKRQQHIDLTRQIIALKEAEAQAELKAAQVKAAIDKNDTTGSGAYLNDQKEIARLKAVIEELQKQGRDNRYSNTVLGQQERAEDTGTTKKSFGESLKDALGLDDAKKDWDNANGAVEHMAAVAEMASDAFSSIVGTVNQAIDAYKKGGVLGAAGSLLSSGPLSDALSAIPVVGAFVKPFGQILSSVSSLFSANIQRILNDVKEKIADINTQASLGNITLSEQIKELQREKQSAISQLGGSKKKGAKKELDDLLKTLNNEIAQLQKQQREIITNFNQMVAAASLGSSVMTDWYTTWTQINQQVKQYVDAGGDLNTAAKFLNQQLQQQQQKLQDQLNSGNQTAIGDAIQLNTLIAQRLQMVKDEAATEFGIINADSLERRTSNAVKLGSELSKQRAQYALQLADINNQVSLTQMKVDAEGKIFNINKDLAHLQADSNALTLISLNEQLAKYQDMQKLLLATRGLIFGPGNIPTGARDIFGIPGEPTVAGPITVNVSVNGNNPNGVSARELAQEILAGIRAGRSRY